MMESIESSTETETICLSDNIARVIFEQISVFYRENEFFDTVIMAGNKGDKDHLSISAHRMVLSALSQYFREAYRDAQTVLMKNVLEFPEIDPQVMKSIVDFMHSGTIELNVDTVEGILSAAIFLKIKILIECCCEFIEKRINDPSNCMLFFRVSRPWPEERSLCSLKEKSMEFIYLNFDELSKEDEFLMLTEREIKDLLSYESRHSDIEEAVFMSILAWINHDKLNREHLIVELLKMIRYQFLPIKFIAENMSVCKSPESIELISVWLKYHVSPETRTADQKHLEVSTNPQTLKLLNDFMSSGEIELNIENVEGILRAAVFRKQKHLIGVCCEFVQKHINTSNYLSWFRLSTELSLSQIKEKSMDVIYMNFEQMWKDEEFLMLTEMEIKSLLSYENPYTDFEEEVFKAICAWVNYDKPNREHLTADLLRMIRFQYLSTKFKADNNSLITDWLKCNSLPETTDQEEMFFKSRFEGLLFVHVDQSNTIAIHMYDHKTDAWHKKIQIPLKKNMIDFSTIVINNKLFVVGGRHKNGCVKDDIECFDLYTLKWISRSHMHCHRWDCQLSELDGQLCIYGGYNCIGCVDEIELYNPTTGEITDLYPPYVSMYSEKSTCKGVLYLIHLKEGVLQFYDSRTQNWTRIKIHGQPINSVRFVADEKNLYFLNGWSYKGVKRYDLEKKSWSGDFEEKEYRCIRTMMVNNRIVIFRKPYDSETVIFEEYNPNTNTWRKLMYILSINDIMFDSCSIGSYTA